MPTLEDIRQAARDLEGRIHRTPMLTSSALNERFAADLVLKAELFQKPGSLKARGLLTNLRRLTAEERERGVIRVAGGNAAGARAGAARAAGGPATVVMAATAVPAKI